MKLLKSPHGTPVLDFSSAAPNGAVAVLPCGNLPLGMVSVCRWIGACLVLTLVLDCRNVTVRDLHLDGSNTHPKAVK